MTAPALIELEPDPRTPGRTAFRVTSLYSPDAVRRAVAEIMDADGVAVAEFTHVQRAEAEPGRPKRWQALGYTITRQSAVAA